MTPIVCPIQFRVLRLSMIFSSCSCGRARRHPSSYPTQSIRRPDGSQSAFARSRSFRSSHAPSSAASASTRWCCTDAGLTWSFEGRFGVRGLVVCWKDDSFFRASPESCSARSCWVHPSRSVSLRWACMVGRLPSPVSRPRFCSCYGSPSAQAARCYSCGWPGKNRSTSLRQSFESSTRTVIDARDRASGPICADQKGVRMP
jgi:hypothetical protein